MNWQEKLLLFVKNKNWIQSINLMKETIKKNPSNSWAYIQSIYLFHNILLEENYPEEKQEELVGLLKKYFKISKNKFSNDPEYLFFIGKILHIAEWYFGLDDNLLAFEFQKKAMNKEPDNLLYKWAYLLSYSRDNQVDHLAHQILTSKNAKVSWLKTKGFPGEYILEHLKMSKDRYVKNA